MSRWILLHCLALLACATPDIAPEVPCATDAPLERAWCTATSVDDWEGTFERTYDACGRLVQEDLDSFGVIETQTWTWVDDQLQSWEERDTVWNYTYDAEGRLIEAESRDAETGAVWRTETYTYAEADHTHPSSKRTQGSYTSEVIYSLDASGLPVSAVGTVAGVHDSDHVFEHDVDGHLVRWEITYVDGLVHEKLLVWSGDLLLRDEMISTDDGGWRLAYTYDALGREIERAHLNSLDMPVQVVPTSWSCP